MAELDIFQSDYSAEQIEDEITNGVPRINATNKHWERWDVENQVWVDTGVVAEGTSTGVAWGNITGSISNQTDLNSALSGKESKAVFIQASIVSTASMWSGKTYNGFVGGSFASCDIEVSISPSATDTQRDAYASAMFTGSALDNTLTALGEKPSVDIPVYIRKWSV